MAVSRHACVSVRRALVELKKGNNLLDGTVTEAFSELMERVRVGKKYITGCDKEDADGRCMGHVG